MVFGSDGAVAQHLASRPGWEPIWEPFAVDWCGRVWTPADSEPFDSGRYGRLRTLTDAACTSTDQKVVGSSPAGRATNCKGFWLTMAFDRWPHSPTSVSAQDGGGLSPVKGPSHPETEQWRVRQTTTSGVLLSDSTLRLAGQGRDRRWHRWLRPPPARRRQRRGARGCPNPGMRPRPR